MVNTLYGPWSKALVMRVSIRAALCARENAAPTPLCRRIRGICSRAGHCANEIAAPTPFRKRVRRCRSQVPHEANLRRSRRHHHSARAEPTFVANPLARKMPEGVLEFTPRESWSWRSQSGHRHRPRIHGMGRHKALDHLGIYGTGCRRAWA